MKKTFSWLSVFVCFAGLISVSWAEATRGGKENTVTVDFAAPENFTDISDDSFGGTEQGREAYLSEFHDYLRNHAGDYLKAGQNLHVTITDIDLAGDFEPWRGGEFSDVRFVKAIYPPRMKLVFEVTDAEGRVVKEGQRELSNTSFLLTVSISSDTLRYEKELLEDWMRRDLKS